MPYKIGDIVRCKPRWPNKPAFGIWTKDTVLTTEGRIARVSDVSPWGSYTVQFDRNNDGTFHDAHWGVSEDEIVGLWEERHLHIPSYWSRCEICGASGFYNAS